MWTYVKLPMPHRAPFGGARPAQEFDDRGVSVPDKPASGNDLYPVSSNGEPLGGHCLPDAFLHMIF
jgi:hypothetical protein